MGKDISVDYGDHYVTVSRETWGNLVGSGSHLAFCGIVAGIREVIVLGGHLEIIAEDGTSISRRIDRIREFDEFVDDAKKMRSKLQKL